MIKLSQPNISEESISRVNEVLRSGQLVHGEECEYFEKELAEFIGVKHALVVASGTAALHLSLLALGIGLGDAVLIPDFTFVATANVVEMVGAKAVIVDVNLNTYNMDIGLLEECITTWHGPEKLKAIMPVLEFGNPANLKNYRKVADRYGLYLIEDAACALGAFDEECNAGTVGDFGCFSFHPRKTLTTGEGGLVTTNDEELAEKVKLLRNHGMTRTSDGVMFTSIGLNYRMTNFQAAMGRVILKSLPEYLKKRKDIASDYNFSLEKLMKLGLLVIPKSEYGHSWQTYMVLLNKDINRDNIIDVMRMRGVEVNIGAQSMSKLNLFSQKYKKNNDNGNILYMNGLALPIHECLKKSDVEKVITTLNSVLKNQCC